MGVNMKRNQLIDTFSKDNLFMHKERVAFHEAGHAAGIHLNNKARQLPPVFFKIIFKEMTDIATADVMVSQSIHDEYVARVEGGRLIELPTSLDSIAHELTGHNNITIELTEYSNITMQLVADYMNAFEADIVNLLIGPLAEAKHVADTDNEQFNRELVNLDALKYYGGSSDIALANEYLDYHFADKSQRDSKLNELFALAFDFINNDENWTAISRLAEYVLGNNKNTIYFSDIVSILDQ